MKSLCLLLCLLAQSVSANLNEQTTVRAMKSYQSISHSINQPTQSINQSIDQSINQSINQSISSGLSVLNVTRPEGVRSFLVYASKQYLNSTNPVPLLLSYHGLGDNCHSFISETGFIKFTQSAEPFLLVAPCATSGLIGTAWNAGTCCLQPTKVDDVEFTRAILTSLNTANFPYDPKKVFASGFSNGAMLSEIMGCQLGAILRGIASVSGVIELEPGNESGLEKCDTEFSLANSSLSVLHVHGIEDQIVPFNGDPFLGFPGIEKNMKRWSGRIGCDLESKIDWSNGTFQSISWPCNGNRKTASIQLVTNSVGVHEWPVTPEFDTTAAIIDWMWETVKKDQSIDQSVSKDQSINQSVNKDQSINQFVVAKE